MTSTARNGKIARLPKPIREELNTRLDHNERGPKLLAWLNTHPDVQPILADQFEGRPISQQNLSEWRLGGYQDWLELQEKRHLALKALEQNETLAAGLDPASINTTYATVTAIDFIQTTQARLKACTDPDKRSDYLFEIQNQLLRLRREDCRAGHLKLRQDKWNHQLATDKHTADTTSEVEARRQVLAWHQLQPKIEEQGKQLGGSNQAFDRAAFLLEMEHNLNIGFLGRKGPEFAQAEEEFHRLHNLPSEGRVLEPIIGRVPNIEPPTTPALTSDTAKDSRSPQHAAQSSASTDPSNPSDSPAPSAPSPIPLANSCTPGEFTTRPITPTTPTRHASACHSNDGRHAVAKLMKTNQNKSVCRPKKSKSKRSSF